MFPSDDTARWSPLVRVSVKAPAGAPLASLLEQHMCLRDPAGRCPGPWVCGHRGWTRAPSHHLLKAPPLLLIGWRPSHSVLHQDPAQQETALRMLRVQGRGPLQLDTGSWPGRSPCFSSLRLLSRVATWAPGGGLREQPSCGPAPAPRQQQQAARVSPMSPQMLPERSSGLGGGPRAGGPGSLGPRGPALALLFLRHLAQSPCPCLPGQTDEDVSILVWACEGSEEIHLPRPSSTHTWVPSFSQVSVHG